MLASLAWFEAQAARGRIGEIDREATADGAIAGKGGFRATTVGPAEFRRLAAAPAWNRGWWKPAALACSASRAR